MWVEPEWFHQGSSKELGPNQRPMNLAQIQIKEVIISEMKK